MRDDVEKKKSVPVNLVMPNRDYSMTKHWWELVSTQAAVILTTLQESPAHSPQSSESAHRAIENKG